MNIKEKEDIYTLENLKVEEKKEISKKDIDKGNIKKKRKNISFSRINWYLLIKVTNSLFFLFCLSNPYLVGFYARWTVEEFTKGWIEQPNCFGGSPTVTGMAKEIPFHLETTCAPSGE